MSFARSVGVEGWTVAVKEIIDVAGAETTANTEVRLPDAFRFPASDAPVIARLRAAGMVIGAKTRTHEFAWGITTAQPDRPQAVNPAAPGHVTGGSSGGAAAAVAGGETRVAVGTDTGGSVRIPAAWCGIAGWKPTMGLVPTAGVLPLAPSLDHVGFLATTVADLIEIAALFGASRVNGGGLRVAFCRSDAPMDAATRAALDDVAGRLTAAGMVRVADAELPASETMMTAYRQIQIREALVLHRDVFGTWPSQRDAYARDVASRLAMAEAVTDADELRGRLAREAVRSAVFGHFVHADVLVTATTGCAPPTVERPEIVDVDGTELAIRDVVLANTVMANLTGFPAVTVPIGEGTPAQRQRGIQLIGAPGADARVLAAAECLTNAK